MSAIFARSKIVVLLLLCGASWVCPLKYSFYGTNWWIIIIVSINIYISCTCICITLRSQCTLDNYFMVCKGYVPSFEFCHSCIVHFSSTLENKRKKHFLYSSESVPGKKDIIPSASILIECLAIQLAPASLRSQCISAFVHATICNCILTIESKVAEFLYCLFSIRDYHICIQCLGDL